MAGAALRIDTDVQKLIELKKRMEQLKSQLLGMNRAADPKAFDQLNRELQRTTSQYNKLGSQLSRYIALQNQASKSTQGTSSSMSDMQSMLAKIGGTAALVQLGKQIVNVHGEMQQLNIAFSTMLKSQEKADTLMSGLKTFATDTPFGLMDSAKGAKQLLAYGTTAENIIGDLKMLGNVASGVSAPLGDIVYLYGTLRSQGRAYAVDIRQFAGRGIPIYAELAKVLKVNVDQVNDLVSAGKVGFPEVEQAFKNMTSGGGMFEGLMEKQTASVTGQIEKLKDNIQFMFDAIGTSSEGAIYGAIDGASTLVENYETVGKVLLGLIATYGTYRTAVMLTTLVEEGWTVAQLAHFKALVQVERAQKLLNATMLSNPYVLAGTVLIGLVTTMWALSDSTTAAQKAQDAFNKKQEEAAEREQDHKSKLDELIRSLQDETIASTERFRIVEEIKKAYPALAKQYIDEKGHIRDLIGLWKSYNEEVSKTRMQTNQSEYDKAKEDAKKATDYYNEVVSKYSHSVNYKGVIEHAKSAMDAANNTLSNYESKIQADRISSFMAGIENMTDAQIKAEIDARNRIQSKMKDQGSTSGSTKGGVLDGTFNAQHIKDQNEALQKELDKRNQQKYNYVELDKKYNSELKALQAQRKKIEQDKDRYTEDELKKKLASVDEDIKAKQNEIKDLTNKTPKQQEREDNKAETEANKRIKASLNLKEKLTQLELDTEASRVSAMQDGYDKRKKEIDSEYSETKAKILKNRQDLIDLYNDSKGLKGDAKVTVDNYKTVSPDIYNKVNEAELQAENVKNSKIVDLNRETNAELESLRNDVASKFKTDLNNKLYEIELFYKEQVRLQKLSQDEANKLADQESFLAKKDNDLKYNDVNTSLAVSRFDNQSSGLGMVEYTERQKTEILKQYATERLEILSSMGTEQSKIDAAQLQETINGYDKTLSKPKKIKSIIDEKAFNRVKKHFKDLGQTEEEANQNTVNFFDKFSEGGDVAVDAIETMQGIFGGLNDELDMALNAAMNIAKGFAEGGLVGGLQAAASQVISATVSLMSAKKEVDQSMIDGYNAYVEAIDRLIDKQIESLESLGSSDYSKEALKTYNDLVDRIIASRNLFNETMKSGSSMWSHSLGYKANKMLKGYSDELKKAGVNTTDLNKMTNDQLVTLMSIPEVWGKLHGDLRQYIEDMAEAKDKAAELQDEIQSMMLGFSFSDITDAIVDAFSDNSITKALDTVSDKIDDWIGQVVGNIIKQVALIEPVTAAVNQLMKDVGEYDSSGNLIGFKNKDDISSSVFGKFKDTIMNISSGFGEIWQDWAKELSNIGIDISGDSSSSQSASSGYSTSMSQDTGEAIEGRMTAMQMNLISIDSNVARIAEWNKPIDEKQSLDALIIPINAISNSCSHIELMMEENRNITLNTFYKVSDIEKHTKQLYQMNDRLGRIERNTNGFA
ncbi:tape measure protein [Dysgonomonas capnocytophagoides]|uniref:tape measure protein n=1 Tax=Dysgonomonas capnocytophagoides TaxID=45254 RepID=UPI0033404F09